MLTILTTYGTHRADYTQGDKAMNAYSMFKTNEEMEKNGVIIPFGGFSITIARAGGKNRRYTNLLTEMFKPHQRSINNETIDPDLMNDLLIKVYGKTVVLGWEGMADEHGKPLEFNLTNFTRVMKDLPDLFDDIRSQSTKVSNYRDKDLDDDVKK